MKQTRSSLILSGVLFVLTLHAGYFFMLLLSSVDFFQNYPFQDVLSGTLPECQTFLDPDQDRHSVGPDLDPNCLQRLSADDKSQR